MLVLLKVLFRIDPAQEAEAYAAERRQAVEPLARQAVVVENPELAGASLDERPSKTWMASTSGPGTSQTYSWVGNREKRQAPRSSPQSPPSGAARSVGAVAGLSVTAWIASEEPPEGARATKGVLLAAVSAPGVRKRRYAL